MSECKYFNKLDEILTNEKIYEFVMNYKILVSDKTLQFYGTKYVFVVTCFYLAYLRIQQNAKIKIEKVKDVELDQVFGKIFEIYKNLMKEKKRYYKSNPLFVV